MKRRSFLWGGLLTAGATGALYGLVRRAPLGGVPAAAASTPERVSIPDVRDPEDVFAWLERVHGGYNIAEYRRVLGAANPYKEGDATQGLAAADESSRENSRRLLANTTIRSLNAHPIFDDEVVRFADAQVDPVVRGRIVSRAGRRAQPGNVRSRRTASDPGGRSQVYSPAPWCTCG